jgi:transposase
MPGSCAGRRPIRIANGSRPWFSRADLVAQRTACTNRLAAPGSQAVQTYLETVRTCLSEQIEALDGAIAETVREAGALARAETVLRSVVGIGHTTAVTLLALMPELGRIDRRQAAALAGLAPHPRQSGATDAYRRTRGGRPELKRALFLPAQTAARHDPSLKEAYQRLRQAGKKPIVAIVAIMRRLIVIANARLRDAYKDDIQLS